MLELAQMLFLALLAGTVAWLAYLAQHQDAAAGGEPPRRVLRRSRRDAARTVNVP